MYVYIYMYIYVYIGGVGQPKMCIPPGYAPDVKYVQVRSYFGQIARYLIFFI
jgi:hypothetical protein